MYRPGDEPDFPPEPTRDGLPHPMSEPEIPARAGLEHAKATVLHALRQNGYHVDKLGEGIFGVRAQTDPKLRLLLTVHPTP